MNDFVTNIIKKLDSEKELTSIDYHVLYEKTLRLARAAKNKGYRSTAEELYCDSLSFCAHAGINSNNNPYFDIPMKFLENEYFEYTSKRPEHYKSKENPLKERKNNALVESLVELSINGDSAGLQKYIELKDNAPARNIIMKIYDLQKQSTTRQGALYHLRGYKN